MKNETTYEQKSGENDIKCNRNVVKNYRKIKKKLSQTSA